MFEPGTDQVGHVTSFFLVDEKGMIVKKYPGYTDNRYKIVQDAKLIVN